MATSILFFYFNTLCSDKVPQCVICRYTKVKKLHNKKFTKLTQIFVLPTYVLKKGLKQLESVSK